MGTVQDITPRKRAERVLLESEARFKMQYRGFPIPTYTWRKQDQDFFLLEYNDAAGEITRGAINSLLGRRVRELYPDRPDIAEDMLRCIGGESPLRREDRFRMHGSGEERDFVFTYVALPHDLVMVHTEDVTERKRAEEQLRQAAIVFESTLEGVIITDGECNIVAVNRAFTDITGYAPDEALGKNPRFLQSGRQSIDFYRELWASLEISGQWQGEIWNRRKNGEVFPTWENISVVKDESDRTLNYISVFSDISVIKNHEERMTHLAHHDALTGLPNRLLFSANLDQALELARRHAGLIALMFIDLDRFKLINDTLGHAVGDQLLQLVAQRLKHCVRAEDTVARLGGDEFTIVMSELSHVEDAAMLAEKFIAAFKKPIVIDTNEMTVGVSIGISVFPDNAADSDGLTKAADAALYRAKERGRNTYEFYTPELTATALEHLAMEQALRAALTREEFELYYLPEVDLSTGEIARVEALLRWRHPQLGLLEPESFMAVAEDSGLIEAIGEWVFRTACEQAVVWRAAGLPGRIAINLSGRQVVRAGLVDKFEAILRDTGAQPAGVELEITESVLNRVEQSRSVLERLKGLGVRLAVDNFGAGYSSLAHLRHLPIDTLKIDRSFVEDVPGNPDAASIVEAIITLGHGLRLTVVGEGVETTAQQDFLRALRCDYVQGNLYSRAVPVEAIEKLLAAGRVSVHGPSGAG
jgi:diguanylate cyclase (GGDEF)-like protein/PAS domain S-box-containing protein